MQIWMEIHDLSCFDGCVKDLNLNDLTGQNFHFGYYLIMNDASLLTRVNLVKHSSTLLVFLPGLAVTAVIII
jgi:hypothetical protein